MSLPNLPSKDGKAIGVNGHSGTNGVSSPRSSAVSSPVSFSTKKSSQTVRSASGNFSVDANTTSLLRSTVQSLEKRSTTELGFGVFDNVSKTTFIELVEFIGTERLSSLPHKGSKWDKVLIRALFFAEQQHGFEKMMRSFGSEDTSAAQLGYGYAKLLLELGNENAVALDKAFAILYKHSLEVSALLHRTELLQTTQQIREQLCLMYSDLLSLTSAVATRYYKAVHGMASSKMSLDINEVCGSVIDSFRDRQSKVAELIWGRQAQLEGFDIEQGVSAKTLTRWLTPNDRVLYTVSQDHMALLGGQAEFTSVWFQKPLTSFAQGNSKVMAVTGPIGSGKTVLAASIAERLQRPLGRQTFSNLFYSINSSARATATPSTVLKALLAQIFHLRVGNMQMYHAVARAYEQCEYSTDIKTYENHLWTALEEAFKKPLANARELIVVVDGLDEIEGGKAAAQAFFEKLADIVTDGKRVKLIGVAETLNFPSGIETTHVELTPDRLHEDIYSVVLRNLMHTRNLTSKPGPEQEQVLERVVRASRGSFIWATLVSQLLVESKSPEEFTKTVESYEQSRPSVQDLVQRVVLKQEIPAQTKSVLSWIVSSARPLTATEIRTMLSTSLTDSPTPTQTDIDVHSVLHFLEPLLLFNENVVRFKHHTIQDIVAATVESGKIGIPAEKRQADILLRLLNYVRTTLREEPDPSFDEYEFDQLERSFREHPLLLYAIRYWTFHLQMLGTKIPPELPKVLPNTSILPQMERTFWSLELPLPKVVDFHKIATHIRSTTLKELSPASLQSTLNLAVIYDMLNRPTEAAPLFFTCVKISRNLLSNYHPLPVECSYRYLAVTESQITSSRTEVMTRREEVLKILVTLFERQYGKHSTQVVEVRTVLAQLYESINEHDRASEIYQSIRESTVELYGKDSSETRDVLGKMQVSLGKVKGDQKVEIRQVSIFDEDEEEHVDEELDIAAATRQIAAAKDEHTFVELWQRISSISRNTTATEWHEKNIDVAMEYAKYLKAQKRTEESSAIATSIAREYESNQASYSESVVSRLHQTASFLREVGQFSAALAILQRTSQFYSSMKRQESSSYHETQKQISMMMTELSQKDTSDLRGHLLIDIFMTAVKDESKPVDAKLMAMAKTLAVEYMDESKPSQAVEVVRLVLHRTWPAFIYRAPHDVDMTNIFPKETVELVELSIECYARQRSYDMVETNLTKLFQALLTPKTIDFALVNKIKTHLIKHYDEQNYSERSITILQKLLAAQRTHLGPASDETIKTLYELGHRSREKARSYPFWIDYYQQIVTVLNKDALVSQPRAMEALTIVATSYWEDRRYPEAVHAYGVLWNTFVQKPKDHPQFAQPEFVERLYERYYSCLEQTGARFELLYEVSTQYRKTCIAVFGAQSTVTTKATLALARICYSNERHSSEALGWYEEVSKLPSSTSHSKSEIKDALSVLYTRQVIASSSSNASSETVERARSQVSEQYAGYVSKYGYAHESSLSRLHELALLYTKQSKSEAASKELTTASKEIITKETSSVRMIQAAESIFQSFQASNNSSYCSKFVSELHKQVVAKDTSGTSSWAFDFTKYGRSVLPFLATLEFYAHGKRGSFSQLTASLTLELMYFEEYRKLVRENADLRSIIITASKLRRFLVRSDSKDMVDHIDSEVGHLFTTRDAARLKFKSKDSGRLFMVAIMEYLGTYKTSSFVKAVILASNESLEHLMRDEKYAESFDIAGCAFAFALDYEGYSGPKGISHGFKLASLLAGIGLSKKCSDAALRKQMLHLSNDIVKKVLEICKKQEIDFAHVQLREINRLVILLGEQEDYETLEWLLTTLWNSRSAQRTWSPNVLNALGRQLICARYLAGHPIKALRLCEDIAYNMRRTRGASHPATTETNNLLAQLYTSSGQYYLEHSQGGKDKSTVDLANSYLAKALGVHEEMLRLLVNDATDGGIPGIDDDEDLDTTGAILAEHGVSLDGGRDIQDGGYGKAEQGAKARLHLDLLRLAHQRLGAWPKPHAEYERLVAQAVTTFQPEMKDVQTAEKWQTKGYGGGKAERADGQFRKVGGWELMV